MALLTRFAFLSLVTCLAIMTAIPRGAHAGVTASDVCDGDCVAAFQAFAPVYFSGHAPVLAARSETFEAAATANGATCPKRSGQGPVVFGAMLGPTYGSSGLALEGPLNDIQLMRQVMLDRGVAADHIIAVQGGEATRAGMLKTMAAFLPCLRERDQIVLFFTGWAGVYPHEWFSPSEYFQSFCAQTGKPDVEAICTTAVADDVPDGFLESLKSTINQTAIAWHDRAQPISHYLPGGRQHVLMADDSAWAEADGGLIIQRLDGVTAAEMSNFVSRVRNRGADAFLIIDTRLAGSGDLLALQQQAGAPDAWAADGDVILEHNGFPPIQNDLAAQGMAPLFGSGHFAVIYGSDQNSSAFEYRQGADRRQLGALTFRVSELLRSDGAIRFADLARALASSFGEYNAKVGESNRQDPMFMASNLDLTLLAPRAEGQKKASADIEIITPEPTRGSSEAVAETITIVARYAGTGKARMGIIDGELVPIDGNGQFRRDIDDTSGLYTVALRVLGGNYETLASAELRVRDKPDDPVLPAPARRVALVIANEDYSDTAFPDLATPVSDAESIVAILREKFGFVTAIDGSNGPIDLFLKNASKAQIQQALYELRRRLTADDQLLIYYAGHGENDPALGAYWVPVDGVGATDYTWYAAEDISRELVRMNAQSVLVISDSCYAGGLARASAEARPEGAARQRYLAKASRLKARQLIASGGEEPVSDGGGDGHSVFARALIEALRTMPDPVFTANELLELKIKPAVIASASAVSDGQIPGFHRISRAGDEPSSEFVFQSADAP